MLKYLSGPLGYALVALLLAGLLIAGLQPFRLRPAQDNHAVVRAEDGMRFPGPGLLRAAATPEWLGRAIEGNQLRIELRLQSYSPHQFGPARIFTISRNPLERNLTIGQEGADLIIRLRTPATCMNGLPPSTIPGVFRTPGWRNVTVAVLPRTLRITLDGEQILARPLPARPLANWDPRFGVAFGNEVTGERPWRGAISRARIRVDGYETDLTAGAGFDRPTSYWPGFQADLFPPLATLLDDPQFPLDAALNFLGFIPAGLLVGILWGKRRALLLPTLCCAFVSLCLETSQFFIDTRYPSGVDVLLNTAGAFVGALAARRTLRRIHESPQDHQGTPAP
jgi:hypothetical protein